MFNPVLLYFYLNITDESKLIRNKVAPIRDFLIYLGAGESACLYSRIFSTFITNYELTAHCKRISAQKL